MTNKLFSPFLFLIKKEIPMTNVLVTNKCVKCAAHGV